MFCWQKHCALFRRCPQKILEGFVKISSRLKHQNVVANIFSPRTDKLFLFINVKNLFCVSRFCSHVFFFWKLNENISKINIQNGSNNLKNKHVILKIKMSIWKSKCYLYVLDTMCSELVFTLSNGCNSRTKNRTTRKNTPKKAKSMSFYVI